MKGIQLIKAMTAGFLLGLFFASHAGADSVVIPPDVIVTSVGEVKIVLSASVHYHVTYQVGHGGFQNVRLAGNYVLPRVKELESNAHDRKLSFIVTSVIKANN